MIEVWLNRYVYYSTLLKKIDLKEKGWWVTQILPFNLRQTPVIGRVLLYPFNNLNPHRLNWWCVKKKCRQSESEDSYKAFDKQIWPPNDSTQM